MSDKITIKLTNTIPPLVMQPNSQAIITTSMSEVVQIPSIGGGFVQSFTWTQNIALAVWTIPHNMGKYPSVAVCDHVGNIVHPDISYIDNNTVQITHGSAFAGKAYLN